MKTLNANTTLRAGLVMLLLSVLAMVMLPSCSREDPIAPSSSSSSTGVDDHGSGGHGSDDNGGGG